MTAPAGRDMASVPDLPPDLDAEQAALGLRHLHALDPAGCPFRRLQSFMFAEARRHLNAGLIDETDFDDQYQGETASSLFARLTDNPPPEDDLVVCHGDARLPNLLIAEGRFSGFVDCARLGVADRHQDLALALSSVARNLGTAAVDTFLAAYGHEPNARKLAFYRILDEFF